MQLKNDLWDFAPNFYQQPEVEPTCLLLQAQFGVSINRLIYAVWCGCRCEQAVDGASQGADRWQREVTHALRAIRFNVREKRAELDGLDACYRQLRQAELACEQVELAMLYQQPRVSMHDQDIRALVLSNIKRYLVESNVAFDAALEVALQPILSAINHYL